MTLRELKKIIDQLPDDVFGDQRIVFENRDGRQYPLSRILLTQVDGNPIIAVKE